jgi:hypothetical protein
MKKGSRPKNQGADATPLRNPSERAGAPKTDSTIRCVRQRNKLFVVRGRQANLNKAIALATAAAESDRGLCRRRRADTNLTGAFRVA